MSFADIWDAADGDWQPPGGTYEVVIVDGGGAGESNDGKPFAKVMLQVAKGEHRGKNFEHFLWMGSAVAARISKESLAMYGVDAARVKAAGDDGLDVLDQELDRLVGTRAEVTVKHKDGYVNTTVIRAYFEESDATAPEDAALFETAPATPDARNAIQDDDDIPY